MKEVTARLIPQILQWMTTGVVAKGKILHAGITQARAIVRNKAGKKVEFGLQYLINRIGGGYLFGSLLLSSPNESEIYAVVEPQQADEGSDECQEEREGSIR